MHVLLYIVLQVKTFATIIKLTELCYLIFAAWIVISSIIKSLLLTKLRSEISPELLVHGTALSVK